MKKINLVLVFAAIVFATTACIKIPAEPPPTKIDAVYLLEFKWKDSSGFPGIFVTDSESMRVSNHHTTVTISDIRNFSPKAVPEKITSGNINIAWVPDAVGTINITGANGDIAIDYFGQDSSYLGLHFIHAGTHYPKYHRTIPPTVDEYWGGETIAGFPGDTFFTIISSKKAYDNKVNGIPSAFLESKMTRL